MTIKYTKEQLNKFDKDLLIELFLGMQGQMEELSRQTQALNDRMQLMIVTGMSGAGKSKAINALEDIGYYCVDICLRSFCRSWCICVKPVGMPASPESLWWWMPGAGRCSAAFFRCWIS